MTTSLAAQLQKLAVPQTSLLERDKKRPSLLFDPKEAAAIDKDTFYDIGLSGLRDLKALDEDFSYFENNLFSLTSKNIERAVQDIDTNQNLNKTIKKFFTLLSPYFLLKPSHKALEWLIQRFSVHDYNRDDFLKLILPYHETNIFVRCLRLFKIKNKNDDWNWLYPLQKSGFHLPKITLYNHCATNVGFLKFIGIIIIEAVEEKDTKPNSLATLFSFYCTTIIGTLENINEITEPQLTAILPPMLKGMLSNIPDYTASTYMIIAQLLKKNTLSHKLLNILVERISNQKQEHLRMEATLLLLLVYQSQQDHFRTISDKAVKNLADNVWFVKNLSKLAAGGSYVLPLWTPVLCSSLKMNKSYIYRRLIEKLFTEIHLNDNTANILIRVVIDACPTSAEDDNDSSEEDTSDLEMQSEISVTDWYVTLLKQLEDQYPNVFDKIIREILSGKSPTSQKQAQALKYIMNLAMSGGDEKSSYTIFEKLYHPNADFRHAAVEFLVKNYNSLSEKDKDIFQGAVNERMLDEDSRIIKTILKLEHNELLYLFGENNFVNIAIKLLIKCIQEKRYLLIMSDLIKHICYGEISKKRKLLLPVLPFLFPINDAELSISKKIISSDLSNHYVFLQTIESQIKSVKKCELFCEIIYRNLINKGSGITQFFDITNITKEMVNIHKYLYCILVASSLPEQSSVELGVQSLLRINSYLGQTKCSEGKGSFNIVDCISHARNKWLPLEGFSECIKIVIRRTEYIKLSNAWLPSLSSDHSVKFLINMLILLVKGCHLNGKRTVRCYSALFKIFMNKFFPTFKEKIIFLSNILLNDNYNNKINDTKTQLRIVKILTTLLLQSKESIIWTIELNSSSIVTAVLIGLIHELQEIRMITFDIVNYLANIECINKDKTYIPLLQELLKHKQEIVLDSEQLPLIVCTAHEHIEIKASINFLFTMINENNIPIHVKSKLLQILTFVNYFDTFEETAQVATNILKCANNENIILDIYESFIVYNVLLRFNENTANSINLNSSSWEFINLALQQDVINLEYQQDKYSCPSVLILDQINKEVFNNLHKNVQSALIEALTNIASVSENPEVVTATYKIMKKLDVDAKLFVEILTIMKNVKSNKTNLVERKFRRVNEIPSADILDMIEWKRGITILEFIQDKKKLTNSNILLPELFGILKKCLDFDEQGAVEYPKQIVLSTVLHICNKLKENGLSLPTATFNMELVVQCIRASQNPQTHHHALLVLAHAAALVPDQVLHNIMAIFTFMGSSVLRHDDAYSFQIISKIIDTVIPILVRKSNKSSETNVASVLRVFVDVMLDIPEHRRMPLFKKLLFTLGVDDYMWLFLVLIFEAHVIHGNDSKSKEIKSRLLTHDVVPKRLDIATKITLEFPPSTVISTIIKLLEYLKSLPNETDENMMEVENIFTFNIKQHTPKQFRHFKYTLVIFLSGLLSSKQLVNAIAVLHNDDLLDLEPFYKNMIINILTFIQSISKVVDRTSNTPQAQYWKIILHHSFDIMDSINALLTTEMFLLVIRGLIVHNIPTVRRKSMEILNNKLQHHPSFFYSSTDETEIIDSDGLFALIPSILNIIKSVEQTDIEPEQELTQQTALLSLKLLIKLLGANNPEKFIPILNYITDLIKSKKLPGNILASVVLCLAELCNKLRAHAIPGLVRYMPALVTVLKNQKNQEVPGLLLMCIVTAIQKIVESLPLFLSPYLEKLLCELTILSARWSENEDNQKITPLVKKLDSIRSNIGSVIPARILIPIITQSYCTLLKGSEFSAVKPLMSVLAENLSHLRGTELTIYLPELTTFFLNALEFRTEYAKFVSTEVISTVEENLVKTVTVLVLKLSETTFRPFYYRLFDWAVHNDAKTERVITFYRLSFGFAESLKSLFVLFAGHFVKNAASLLDSCNIVKFDSLYFTDEVKNFLLIESILRTLKSVFSHDSQNFVDKDRFETLMQPIVDQLENTVGGIEILTNRADEILIPCIAQFAVAIGDDSLWKQLNYQILLKMRHNLPGVRLIALNCLCEVARKLGEEFLPLLPETIPFLAELLEDEDELVESRCQKVVQDLEKILGEPLQKYF